MPYPFDASLKELIASYPADWLRLVGLSTAVPIAVIDSDLSTVSAAADKVLHIREDPSWLLHLEMNSSSKASADEYLHWYNTLLRHHHGQRVRTVLVLLRPSADSPRLTGIYREAFLDEPAYLEFRYGVIRVWQIPAEVLLTGPLGTLSLAPISAATEAELPAVVEQFDDRLQREATSEQAAVLGSIAMVLTGLRLTPEAILTLYQGAHFMSILEDSSMYPWFQERGKITEARTIILRLGQKRFGPPDETTTAAVRVVNDLERLERMSERLLDVTSWQDLLATE